MKDNITKEEQFFYDNEKWVIETCLSVLQLGITGESWLNLYHRQFKIRQPVIAIISLLYSSGGSMEQQQLILSLRRTRQAITTALKNLEKKNLIVKESAMEDRRMRIVKLTKKGMQFAQNIRPAGARLFDIISSCISEKEGRRITKMLDNIERSLSGDIKVKLRSK